MNNPHVHPPTFSMDLAHHGGLTLRDYFAAAALDGLTAVSYLDIDEIARTAYALADEMLAAREASE